MKVTRWLAGACAACVALQVYAHAMLDHAEPRVGSSVQAPPQELRLWFTERLEPAFSSAQVLDAAGRRVDAGKAQVDDQDRMLLRVSLASLPPGVYTVTWRAVSVDTHATEGRFEFRVGR